MPKRSWNEEAESHSPNGNGSVTATDGKNGALTGRHTHKRPTTSRPRPRTRPSNDGDDAVAALDPSFSFAGSASGAAADDGSAPQHRKAKACVACRRQKIKCVMEDSGPPCRRCAKKDLECVVNKSAIQSLLEENYVPFKDAVIQDLDAVYANIQHVLGTLNLPPMAPLQINQLPHGAAHSPTSQEANDGIHGGDGGKVPELPRTAGPSCDVSPSILPQDETDLPHVPIRSVYHLTKLSALRSPDDSADKDSKEAVGGGGSGNGGSGGGAPSTSENHHPDGSEATATASDLVSRGLLSLEDAERLFALYIDRLDHYMYGVVNSRYRHLADVRRRSPILAAAILTVAAMHEPHSSKNGSGSGSGGGSGDLYTICNGEFRRLVTLSLLDRRVDRDYLRALCVASYWLNDISWVLSGVACRRAAELDAADHFTRLTERHDEDSADFIRVWYLIYICDQHLSTLYARECCSREDAAVVGYEAVSRLPSHVVTTGDQRLLSQVALLQTIHNVRELFGNGSSARNMNMTPAVLLTQIKGFARQLDQWLEQWRSMFPEYQEGFGAFPRKGALFHYHFAKLYLYSHTFQWRRRSAGNATAGPGAAAAMMLPPELSEPAHGAVSAATSILDMIVSDPDVGASLIGLPCYVQSMIGFACMVLTRLACARGDESSLVERAQVVDLIARLKAVYEATPVGRWHLVHLMPRGFDKVLATLRQLQKREEEEKEVSPGGTTTIFKNGTVNDTGNGIFGQHQHHQGPSLFDDGTGAGFTDGSMTELGLDPFFMMEDLNMNMGLDYAGSQQMYMGNMSPEFMNPNGFQ